MSPPPLSATAMSSATPPTMTKKELDRYLLYGFTIMMIGFALLMAAELLGWL